MAIPYGGNVEAHLLHVLRNPGLSVRSFKSVKTHMRTIIRDLSEDVPR